MSCRELRNGRRFSQKEGEIRYRIDGVMTAAEAMAALIGGSPATVAVTAGEGGITLPRQVGDCAVESRALIGEDEIGIWDGVAKYALSASAGRPIPVVGEKVTTFSIGRGSRTARQALSSRAYTSNGAGKLVEKDRPSRVIGFDRQSGSASGCEVSYPIFSITVASYFTAAQFDSTYRGHLREIVQAPLNNGTVTIYGFGTVDGECAFFEGLEAQERGAEKDWEVRFSFKVAYPVNLPVKFLDDATAVNVPVGGFEVLDMIYAEEVSGDGEELIVKPDYALVHKIYETSDFGYLQPGYTP